MSAAAERIAVMEGELEGIDRVEREATTEERGIGVDVVRLDVLEHQGLDDEMLELAFEFRAQRGRRQRRHASPRFD